ncbi:MAG: glycosyltransferase family 39 protein [Candidatus Omnitrophica bacterium]|nr:glycosyltransferase family 39 protein [Candidatus Omnitrophota bacterium]
MEKASNFKVILALVFLSSIFLMFGNGAINLTHPDEVFYAQTAKEMKQQETWLVPYLFGQPQFEKPIFTFWLLRIGFAWFGVSNFTARLFPSVFAILGAIAVYFLGLNGYKDKKKAFLCALVLMSSGLYIGLARTVFTDMIFSVFILLSLTSFFWGYTDTKRKASGIILFFVFSALAVLTKGPLGFLLPALIIILFLAIKKELNFIFCRASLLGLAVFLLLALPWYVFMINKFGKSFTQEFFYNDHIRRLFKAEHSKADTWYFYPLSMFGSMFPWSIFVAGGFIYLFKEIKRNSANPIYLFLASWIFVILAVFQIAHSKLVSYILPLFPALALVTGDFISTAIISRKHRMLSMILTVSWFFLLLLPIGLIISVTKYSKYVPSKIPVYGFIVFYSVVLAAMLFFLIRRKFMVNVCLLSFQLPLILFFVFSQQQNFDSYVSNKNACEYLLNNHNVENSILCSKPFVRGVRFYTDKEVAVVNLGRLAANFFSPHPLTYLDTDENALDFLKKRPVTYCILTKTSFKDMQRLARDGGVKVELLKIIGDEYIVKILPN